MQNRIKAKLKLSIDILMFITFLFTIVSLVFSNKIVHQISGLITVPLVGLHFMLNFNWIKGITKNLFKNKIKKKTVFQYILFILLTAVFITVIVTGILTSSFVGNATAGDSVHRRHTIPAIIFMVIAVTHILLHLRYIKSSLFKKKKAYKEK